MTSQCQDWLTHNGLNYLVQPILLQCIGDEHFMAAKRDLDRQRRLGYRCSSCWRGYVAYWEVIDGRLHLVKFDTLFQLGPKSKIKLALVRHPVPAYRLTAEVRSELDGLVGTVYEPTHPIEHAWIFERGVLQSRVLRAVYVPTAEERGLALRRFIDNI